MAPLDASVTEWFPQHFDSGQPPPMERRGVYLGPAGSLVTFEVDRAHGKAYLPRKWVNVTPAPQTLLLLAAAFGLGIRLGRIVLRSELCKSSQV